MKNVISAFALILAPFALMTGCDPDPDEEQGSVEEGIAACQDVCVRFGECAPEGDSFDEASCTADCESEAETDDNFASDAVECKECVDADFGANGDPDTCPSDFTLCTSECQTVIARSN